MRLTYIVLLCGHHCCCFVIHEIFKLNFILFLRIASNLPEFQGLPRYANFVQTGPSGTVCVYDYPSNTDACNLSPVGSFCRLNNKYFGPDEIICADDGQCFLRDCLFRRM